MKFRLPSWQPTSVTLIFLVAVYFVAVFNLPFLRTVFTSYQPIGNYHDYFIYTLPIFLLAACNVLFHLVALPVVHKVIFPTLILLAAAVSYNSLFFNVYFNREMLDNVLQTNAAETWRMMSPSYVAWLVFLGVVPAVLYVRTRLNYARWHKELGKRLLSVAASVLVILGIAGLFYQDYASFFRNNSSIKHLIVPTNFIGAGISKVRRMHEQNIPYQSWSASAQSLKPDEYRHVSVIVLGETTRAQNWGLNGYAKQTTPNMAARLKRGDALINFHQVSSCGTATALSVPCMFSAMARTEYHEATANRQDNLLDALQYAGVKVHWIENNSDCKGVCKNVPTTNVITLNLPEFCHDGECLDNIMLPKLDELLSDDGKEDMLIVLHTIGSHGPTYYERYTDKEKLFTPTCDTKEINRCDKEQLINTYDNTIIYLDQLLEQVISRLEQRNDWESSLLYVSDHGESLGENGMYLHGAPYAIAPKEQTSVPMLMWFSKNWVQNEPFDLACVADKAKNQPYSHDNLFHTVFSMMDVKMDSVSKYQADLDILASCKKS